ncbi:hypothetical protein COX67_01950 [Candidatus Falkowbacteria bacterium CG_4_10_14_0_2_um_filter_36_22]|nr:MAG: hypothetical protein COX67_01950 [Candidatus Falkowbacteria bacterium CG_4_10_14_0_2_um_filter_36_22]
MINFMHVYIYDSFLNKKRYEKVLTRVETRITDLGLNGKISRMGLMKNITSTIANELKRGAKTIVAVGNDATVNQVINAMLSQKLGNMAIGAVPLGIIPIDKNKNSIARSLGISWEENACDVLSARRIKKLDIGTINNYCFLANARISNQATVLEISRKYTIEIIEPGEINIINLRTDERNLPEGFNVNPQDGLFELLINSHKAKRFLIALNGASANQSIFPLKKLTIINKKNQPVVIDNFAEVPTPATVNIIKQRIKIIVGKERSFI